MSTAAPGIDPHKYYPARVVHNDPKSAGEPASMHYLGLIRARVPLLQDETADDDLPWAIPLWDHPDGASAESGICTIPKVGSKVWLKFQGGSPAHPVYRGYHSDATTVLEEVKHNYPNRGVVRFRNGTCLVVDTTSNEVYIQFPGDTKLVVAGNLDLTVLGNYTTRVSGDSALVVNGKLTEKSKTWLKYVAGNADVKVGGNLFEQVTGTITQKCSAAVARFALSVAETATTTHSVQAMSITQKAAASILAYSGGVILKFATSTVALLSGSGGAVAVGGSGGSVSMSSDAPIKISSGGRGIDLDPEGALEMPQAPSVDDNPAAPADLVVTQIQSDKLTGMPRGAQPSEWSDNT